MEKIKYIAKKDSFIHRSVAGSDVLISVGANVARFNGYIQLNSVGAFIWETLLTPVTIDELVDAVMEKFYVDNTTALADTTEFLQELLDNEMVEKL